MLLSIFRVDLPSSLTPPGSTLTDTPEAPCLTLCDCKPCLDGNQGWPQSHLSTHSEQWTMCYLSYPICIFCFVCGIFEMTEGLLLDQTLNQWYRLSRSTLWGNVPEKKHVTFNSVLVFSRETECSCTNNKHPEMDIGVPPKEPGWATSN